MSPFVSECMVLSDHDAMSLLEAGALMSLLPVALAQGAWVRGLGLRLKEPPGPRAGWTGEASAEPLRLLVAGGSTAVGVGARATETSLAPRLAYNLAVRLRRRVEWQVIGGADWTAATLQRYFATTGVPDHDISLVLLGVNDVMGVTSLPRWRRDLDHILDLLDGVRPRLLACSGVPPMARVPALPWPLGSLLGERARQLDGALQGTLQRRFAAVDQTRVHLPVPVGELKDLLARDRFHPSSKGYARWALWLADRLAQEWRALPQVLASAG